MDVSEIVALYNECAAYFLPFTIVFWLCNFLEMARSLAYKMRFRKEHPDFFDPCGLMVFCGPQGCKARAMRAKRAAKSPLKSPRHESEKGG